MTKRTASVGAVLFVLTLALGWVAPSASFASSTHTLACQGQDVGLIGTGLGYGSDAALWSVTLSGSTPIGGTAVTMYTDDPGASGSPALTCFYTLDSSSSATLINGIVEQTLVWDPVGSNSGGCSGEFTDHVYVFVIANGATGRMIDDNLDDDNVAGSGTCSHQ